MPVLPIATGDSVGGVKVGAGLAVDDAGLLSATAATATGSDNNVLEVVIKPGQLGMVDLTADQLKHSIIRFSGSSNAGVLAMFEVTGRWSIIDDLTGDEPLCLCHADQSDGPYAMMSDGQRVDVFVVKPGDVTGNQTAFFAGAPILNPIISGYADVSDGVYVETDQTDPRYDMDDQELVTKKYMDTHAYELPAATTTTLGGVKVGDGLAVNGGVLSATYELPTASATTLGGVKVGQGLNMNGGVLSAPPYELPTASATTLGGVKVGQGLNVTGGVLSASPYELPTASASTLGGVRVGAGLAINSGVLSATAKDYTLPTASASTLGGVKVGDGLAVNGNGVLSATATPYELPTASSSTLGGVKVGNGLTISDGVLSTAPSPLRARSVHWADSGTWTVNTPNEGDTYILTRAGTSATVQLPAQSVLDASLGIGGRLFFKNYGSQGNLTVRAENMLAFGFLGDDSTDLLPGDQAEFVNNGKGGWNVLMRTTTLDHRGV